MEKNATSLRRIFGLILLFLFFEGVVAGTTALLAPDTSVFLACVVMTLLALAVWIVAIVAPRHSRSAAPPEPPAGAAPEPRLAAPASAFTEEVKRLMEEANRRLAGAPAGGQLSTLPLYLVVGLAGSGKTSAVANSGLEARLLAGEVLRDNRIVPTPACNFWLAEGAIFADVSGRVFSGEPGNWESLLRLLSGRMALPWWRRLFAPPESGPNLRGVVLVHDARTFLNAGEQHAGNSRAVHDRLHAIGRMFRMDFPVYTLFAAIDEVPHFAEFFAHLAEAEDRRTLGATLPLATGQTNREVYAEAASNTLAHYFNRLCASLAAKRLTMLAREDFPNRKPAIYEFPRELKRLRGDLVQFLVDVFRPNPLERGPKLRGFYFSGVRQASRELAVPEIPGGTSLSRMGADATRLFTTRSQVAASTMTPAAGQAATVMRWAFLPELFAGVVLADRAVQAVTVPARPASAPRNVAFAATAAVLAMLCLAWTISWSENRHLVDHAAAAVDNTSATGGAQLSMENLERLDGLRQELKTLQPYQTDGPPLGLRWGLYAGDRVIPALRTAYFARFRRMFLDPILSSTETTFAQLQPSAAVGYTDIYSQLKVYRTVAAGACKADKPLLDRMLPAMLPQRAALSPEGQRLADAQIGFYTAEMLRANPYRGQVAENDDATRKAQAYLTGFRGPDRLLRSLVERVNAEHPAATLASYAPNYRAVLSGPDSIEWAYTKNGRDEILQKIHQRDFATAGEPCVVGTGAAAAGLANLMPGDNASSDAVQDLYIREFIQRWKQFLAGYRVLPYRDAQDAAGKLAILSDGNRSPLLALLFMASSNTYTPAPSPAQGEATSAARSAADRAADRGLNRWFPRLRRGGEAARAIVKPAAPAAEHAGVNDIAEAFQPVWTAVDPHNADRFSGPQNAPYIGALAELGDSLRALGRQAGAPPDASLWTMANNSEAKAVADARQLESNLNRTPEEIDTEVKRLIEEPIDHVRAVLPASEGQLMAQSANAAAAKLCRDFDQLRRAYPLNAASPSDLSIDAFNRYFAPGTGELAQIVQQPPLSGMLVRQGKVWIQNPATPQPRLSPQFLRALSAQTQVSELLYANGASQPHIEYAVSLNATGKIPFDFDSAGQNARFTGSGSTSPLKFAWPDASGGGAKLTLRTALTVQAVGPGVWGLFRLLSKAQERRGNVFVFSRLGFEGDSQALLDAEGRPVSLEVTVDAGPQSPVFDGGFFTRLACGGRAVQ